MINAISRHRKTYKKPEQNQGKPFNKKISQCKFCGNDHLWKRELCPAFNKTCSNCGKLNHFRKQCRLPVKRRDEANCIYTVSSKIAIIKDIAIGKPSNRQHKIWQIYTTELYWSHMQRHSHTYI